MQAPDVDDIIIDGKPFNPTVELTETQRIREILGPKTYRPKRERVSLLTRLLRFLGV